MKKLLVICGATSTGKTRLAIDLAKRLNGEILSADSRQVYKGMDVGTGKDLPAGAKLKIPWFKSFGFYEIAGVKVWGYDLVDNTKEFNVAQYIKIAGKIIADIEGRKHLPIIAGGTGLYIKAIVDGIPTAEIPRNEGFRKSLAKKTPDELFEMLARLDSLRAGGMNSSDRKNPRRLIRAIEVAVSTKKPTVSRRPSTVDSLFIGLSAPQNTLFERIEERVKSRVRGGIENEIHNLLKKKIGWKSQPMTSLGYGAWQDYFLGKKSKNEVISDWTKEEKAYAKRQMTWFKKEKRIHWFDITKGNFTKEVEKLAEKWYISKSRGQDV